MDRTYIFIFILFAIALWGAYTIYQPFLLSMTVAMLLAMATTNMSRHMVRVFKSRKLVALIMAVLLIMLIMAPIFYVATTGVEYLSHFDKDSIKAMFDSTRLMTKDIPYLGKWVEEYLRVEKVTPYIKDISLYLTTMGSKGVGFIKNIIFIIVFYAAIVYYQDRFFQLITVLIPAPREDSQSMVSELVSTMEVVLYSIIVTALFEGLLFGIFVGYLGFNGLLFGVIYGFASLIPVIGGAIVWVPVAFYAWSQMGADIAIVVALYSIIVISILADTFVKPMIIKFIKEDMLKNAAKMDELVIFFSISAGMSTYGFWGTILGPAITTFLFAATRVYIRYGVVTSDRNRISSKY